jgi:hypothetical protein
MEDLKSAMEEHMEQMADLVQKFSAELRSGLGPAFDNFIGFFHAIDWKVLLLLRPRSDLKKKNLIFLLAPIVMIVCMVLTGRLVNVLNGVLCCVVSANHLLKEKCQLSDVLIPSCV